ncbi:MAG TPA: hypothetical protein PKM07_05230 [Spirochaetota bacterium]|nr:hypothetical protein [Spirochaetota bacterium]HOH36485.1 hypothetical protein [Spirochaetota bacterium]HPJ14006.1 hypothetical protein [Spirochaetota bacterium]
MNNYRSLYSVKFLLVIVSLLIFFSTNILSADGKKWDGRKYPFKLLNPAKPNSETNPFIIDTAGKLAYFGELAKANLDMVAYGKKNGLTGLNYAFVKNYIKLTADLDMNGSRFEFPSIKSNGSFFDGGGHVISNLNISDRTTPPNISSDTGDAEIELALFQSAGTIKNLTIGKGSKITYHGVEKKLTLKVYAAALAVEADEIDNCHSEAVVTVKGKGDSYMAGLVVRCRFALTNSSNRGSVLFEGDVIDSRMKNLRGKISPGNLQVSGLCTQPSKNISRCYNSGSVTVKASGDEICVGGISAILVNNECSDVYNTGAITVSATGNVRFLKVGGLFGVGLSSPPFTGSNQKWVETGKIFNSGNITVNAKTGEKIIVGGLGGSYTNARFATNTFAFGGIYGFINTYNTGNISVSATGKVDIYAGGIAGNNAMIINSYNSGSVSGNSSKGGILYAGGLGGNDVYIQNSYNIGSVTAKGTGTNQAGGLMGNAGVRWGETDKTLYAVLNGFWLKQNKPNGINSGIKYAKGSYYYIRKSDKKKNALDNALDLMSALDKKKTDPKEMEEDSFYGTVYSFDSPSAKVMIRTDDDPKKRNDLEGTLLANLNKMAEDKSARHYRKWEINGTNGGYPVISKEYFGIPVDKAAEERSKPLPKPDAATAKKIAGVYYGEHRHWTSQVGLYADGTVKLAKTGETGTWSFDGKNLVIKWKNYDPETLVEIGPGIFTCRSYKFLLRKYK